MGRRSYLTLERLGDMPPEELKHEWAHRFGSPAPSLSPVLLRLGIGYKLQEQKYGGLSRSTRTLLRRVSARGDPHPLGHSHHRQRKDVGLDAE